MFGAIIIVVICHYLFSYIINWGLQTAGGSYDPVALFLPPLLAGFLGGVQFVRTEMKTMRLGGRLICAVKSCLAIVLTPYAIGFVLLLVSGLGMGAGLFFALPNIAAMLTLVALVETLVFMLYGLPLVYVGLSIGQWSKHRQLRR
jgi:hypothetical protein